MADDFVAVTDGKIDMAETVVGESEFELRIVQPCRAQLLVVAAVVGPAAVGFTQMRRRLDLVRIGYRHANRRRIAADALQVTLADERSVVARRAHDFDEGGRIER